MRRWGLLGGSFDPVHLGHLWIAQFALEQLGLDRVVWIPAAVPPHKEGGTVAPFSFRLELLRLALAGRERFELSDIERDASRPSFTVETLRRLGAGASGSGEVWLLLGADSLRDLPHWRDPEEIVRLARLAIYGRPGQTDPAPQGWRVVWIDGPQCGLSSSLIRRRLAEGRTVSGMVPAEILPLLTSSAHYRGAGADG